jgi:hypothetical protein
MGGKKNLRKLDFFFNLTNLSAPSAGTQIGEIKKKNLISFFFNLTAASDNGDKKK